MMNDDPRVIADDLHAMSWGEYLAMADADKALRRRQRRYRRFIFAGIALVLLAGAAFLLMF